MIDAYNDFSYEVIDDDRAIDTLRAEVLALDASVTSGMTNITPTDAETGITDIFNQFAKKYNVDVEYKEFRTFLHDIASQSKFDNAITEAIGTKVLFSVARRTQMKLLISMSYLIDRTMDLMELQAKSDNIVTPELLVTIEKGMVWYQQIQQMMDSQKIQDPEKAIDKAVKQDMKENPDKYSIDDTSTKAKSEDSTDVNLIKNLVKSLRDESNNNL